MCQDRRRAHLSLADRGLTFATTGHHGVWLMMGEPIPGIDAFGLLRHPNVTVTVADYHGLAGAIKPR